MKSIFINFAPPRQIEKKYEKSEIVLPSIFTIIPNIVKTKRETMDSCSIATNYHDIRIKVLQDIDISKISPNKSSLTSKTFLYSLKDLQTFAKQLGIKKVTLFKKKDLVKELLETITNLRNCNCL